MLTLKYPNNSNSEMVYRDVGFWLDFGSRYWESQLFLPVLLFRASLLDKLPATCRAIRRIWRCQNLTHEGKLSESPNSTFRIYVHFLLRFFFSAASGGRSSCERRKVFLQQASHIDLIHLHLGSSKASPSHRPEGVTRKVKNDARAAAPMASTASMAGPTNGRNMIHIPKCCRWCIYDIYRIYINIKSYPISFIIVY